MLMRQSSEMMTVPTEPGVPEPVQSVMEFAPDELSLHHIFGVGKVIVCY